jgi:hypothetical protein
MSRYYYDNNARMSAARGELLQKGRERYTKTLVELGGNSGAAIERIEPLYSVEEGVDFDRYTLQTSRPFSSESRQTIGVLAMNATFIGQTRAVVDIRQSVYDTRWFAMDWTSEQRSKACLLLFTIVALLATCAALEHYRTEH